MTTEVVRDERGRWIKAPVSPTPITHANAREMAERRWRKYRLAAANRVMREAAAIDPEVRTVADAWGVLNARLFAELMDRPRGDDVAQLGRNIGALPLPHERQLADGQAVQAQTVNIMQIIGGDAAAEILAERLAAADANTASAADAD